jgi:hypothetical protein
VQVYRFIKKVKDRTQLSQEHPRSHLPRKTTIIKKWKPANSIVFQVPLWPEACLLVQLECRRLGANMVLMPQTNRQRTPSTTVPTSRIGTSKYCCFFKVKIQFPRQNKRNIQVPQELQNPAGNVLKMTSAIDRWTEASILYVKQTTCAAIISLYHIYSADA